MIAGEVVFEALSSSGDAPPTVDALNLGHTGAMSTWHFRKTVLYVKPYVTGRFVIAADGPAQALAWVPSVAWTSANLDITAWVTRSITISGCGGNTSTRYFGGILAADATACIHLRVTPTNGPPEKLRRRLDGGECST